MKSILLSFLAIGTTIAVYSQNDFRVASAVDVDSVNNQWNLSEYMWSRNHSQSGKNDKHLLDFDAIDNWVSLSSKPPIISPNGEYLVYGIQNELKDRLDSVIIQSTNSAWRAVLTPYAQDGFFSNDSRQYIYRDKKGLCFLQTGTNNRRYESDVESYKISKKNNWLAYRLKSGELVLQNLITGAEQRFGETTSYEFHLISGEWLACQLKSNEVVLKNLSSGKEVVFSNISSYQFDPFCSIWFECQSNNPEKDLIMYNLENGKEQRFASVQSFQLFSTEDLLLNTGKELDYVNLKNEKRTSIWMADDADATIENMYFDSTRKQIVFVTLTGIQKTIWYWKEGMRNAIIEVNNQTPGIGDLLIKNLVGFSNNGRYIRFAMGAVFSNIDKPLPRAIQIDVWSYQDKSFQYNQVQSKETNKTYSGLVDLQTNKIVLQERQYEKMNTVTSDFAIISKSGREVHIDRFWEKGYDEDSVWLISLQNGVRRLLPVKFYYNSVSFSLNGKYLIYFDVAKQCNYFSLELATGKLVNISAGVPAWQLGLASTEVFPFASGIKLWLDSGKEFLVFDKYGDIWQLDPSGKKPSICVTNGYGHTHNISFKLLNLQGDGQSFIGKDTLLLSAFNSQNKLHGFYRIVLGVKGDPELLSMDSCYIKDLRDGVNGKYPIKASDANIWIVSRQCATMARNYFITDDFKKYKQLTFLNPQKKYNWLKAELHSFKQLDGTASQGILYKPENFDPAKKYPVIISFYGLLSDRLYQYPDANYITAPSIFENPAWMVSHGYLVFIPDIHFYKSQWGPSTANTIDGAAKYLAQLSYVDKEHIGAVGHSNSGRFGYYLFTHSHAFAAMSVGSGTTNIINSSLSFDMSEQKSMLRWGEVESYGTGLGNLWQYRNSWLDQTSVLWADKASSPLLQFHCKKDNVPVEQAEQMYTALRRLGKRVWWLQYDNGRHTVEGDDAKDWTIRYTQFFDHYLKKAPAPRWMTEGIPNKLKGIETRYELDPAGSCAMEGKNHCYVCEAWNKMYKRETAMFSKPISEWKLDKDLEQELERKTKDESAKLDKEQLIEDKKIVNILKYGYLEDDGNKKK